MARPYTINHFPFNYHYTRFPKLFAQYHTYFTLALVRCSQVFPPVAAVVGAASPEVVVVHSVLLTGGARVLEVLHLELVRPELLLALQLLRRLATHIVLAHGEDQRGDQRQVARQDLGLVLGVDLVVVLRAHQ